jgi:hypothetical protein
LKRKKNYTDAVLLLGRADLASLLQVQNVGHNLAEDFFHPATGQVEDAEDELEDVEQWMSGVLQDSAKGPEPYPPAGARINFASLIIGKEEKQLLPTPPSLLFLTFKFEK